MADIIPLLKAGQKDSHPCEFTPRHLCRRFGGFGQTGPARPGDGHALNACRTFSTPEAAAEEVCETHGAQKASDGNGCGMRSGVRPQGAEIRACTPRTRAVWFLHDTEVVRDYR